MLAPMAKKLLRALGVAVPSLSDGTKGERVRLGAPGDGDGERGGGGAFPQTHRTHLIDCSAAVRRIALLQGGDPPRGCL